MSPSPLSAVRLVTFWEGGKDRLVLWADTREGATRPAGLSKAGFPGARLRGEAIYLGRDPRSQERRQQQL